MSTQLPNQMCKVSMNSELIGQAPVIGNARRKLVIAHNSSMPGSLFPETESAAVMLTNTTPMCELADYISQLLTQRPFDFHEELDIVR